MSDPRLTPAREDLAAKYLEGKVKAARYVVGEMLEVIDAIAPVREAPTGDAWLLTQALMGERVMVYERNEEGWAWGQLARDGYVGWLPDVVLAKPSAAPTHKITAIRTFAFPAASIKLPPIETLVMGSLVTITREDGAFAVTLEGWHLPRRHVGRVDDHETDFVAVAERFLEVPYLWGGRTSQGLDCSALVQNGLAATGRAAPRDSDMMEAALGAPIAVDESLAGLRRGDLVFWKGHVGVMRDAQSLLHANGWHMKVVAETLTIARDRILAKGGGAITSIRRL